MAQPRGVFALKIEGFAKYPRLVPAAGVRRVQAIIFKLCDVDERFLAVWEQVGHGAAGIVEVSIIEK